MSAQSRPAKGASAPVPAVVIVMGVSGAENRPSGRSCGPSRMGVRGRRLVPSGLEHRQDAQWHPAHG